MVLVYYSKLEGVYTMDALLHFEDTAKFKKSDYVPTIQDLEEWFNDSGCPCSGECECWIEHDGICENGFQSWFLVMGLI